MGKVIRVWDGTAWQPLGSAAASPLDYVSLNGIQTLTNKTLTSPIISNPTFSGQATGLELSFSQNIVFEGTTADSFETTLSAGEPTADRVITLPNATTTLAGTDVSQVLTNKDLTSGTNTFPASFSTLTGTETLTNKTLTSPFINSAVIRTPREIITVSATAATGTINFDVSTQGVLYYTTAASANWVLNLRGSNLVTLNSIMAIGEAMTVAFLNTNSTTAYYPTALNIDGTVRTVRWQNGSAPSSGSVSSIDVYTYTVIKTASDTYTVIASQSKFA